MCRKQKLYRKKIIANSTGFVNLWENKLKGEYSLILETTEHEAKESW